MPEDLTPDRGCESRQVHPMWHGRYLDQRHRIRHTVYTYENPEGMAADDLSGDAAPHGQSCDGCRPAPPHHVCGRHFGAVGHAYSSIDRS